MSAMNNPILNESKCALDAQLEVITKLQSYFKSSYGAITQSPVEKLSIEAARTSNDTLAQCYFDLASQYANEQAPDDPGSNLVIALDYMQKSLSALKQYIDDYEKMNEFVEDRLQNTGSTLSTALSIGIFGVRRQGDRMMLRQVSQLTTDLDALTNQLNDTCQAYTPMNQLAKGLGKGVNKIADTVNNKFNQMTNGVKALISIRR